MTFTEKALEIIGAKDDKELYERIQKLTDKQKDMMIASLIKSVKGTGNGLDVFFTFQ